MTDGPTLVFGANGLVGSSIMSSLGREAVPARVKWESASSVRDSVTQALKGLAGRTTALGSRWTIFWAAGRSVITTDASAIDVELSHFSLALQLIAEANLGEGGTLVLISSAGALYRGKPGDVITEVTAVQPTSNYGSMKLAQEDRLTDACAQFGFAGLTLRVATVYGVRQDGRKQQGLVSALVRSVWKRTLVPIYVPRETRRHYVWADDVGRLANIVTSSRIAHAGSNTMRLLYSDRSRSISELVETVSTVCRRRPIVQFMPTNHARDHGLDVTLRSAFHDTMSRADLTGLEVGVKRLYAGSMCRTDGL